MLESGQTGATSSSIPSAESLRRLAVSESGFVFDPTSGHHFTVNETGLVLLRHLQKNQDLSSILNAVTQEYNVNQRDLERDVLEFLRLLREFVGEQ
jgi:hypothetical protein